MSTCDRRFPLRKFVRFVEKRPAATIQKSDGPDHLFLEIFYSRRIMRIMNEDYGVQRIVEEHPLSGLKKPFAAFQGSQIIFKFMDSTHKFRLTFEKEWNASTGVWSLPEMQVRQCCELLDHYGITVNGAKEALPRLDSNSSFNDFSMSQELELPQAKKPRVSFVDPRKSVMPRTSSLGQTGPLHNPFSNVIGNPLASSTLANQEASEELNLSGGFDFDFSQAEEVRKKDQEVQTADMMGEAIRDPAVMGNLIQDMVNDPNFKTFAVCAASMVSKMERQNARQGSSSQQMNVSHSQESSFSFSQGRSLSQPMM